MTYDMTYDMIYDMIYARGLGHVAWDVEPGPGGSGWRNLKGMEERQAKTSEDKRRHAKTSEPEGVFLRWGVTRSENQSHYQYQYQLQQ